MDFRDLWIGIVNNNERLLAERFAYVAWIIWHNRNAARLKTTYIPYNKIYGDMLHRFQEYQFAQDPATNSESIVQTSNFAPIHW